MSKNELFYASEIKAKVTELMLNEISDIIRESCETWKGAPAERKIMTIEGIFNMADAIDEFLSAEKEGE